MSNTTKKELEQYFERDIIEFLDRNIKTNNIDSSIIRPFDEIKIALEQNKEKETLGLIRHAVDIYNSTVDTEPYKKIRYEELLNISELLVRYIKNNSASIELIQISHILKENMQTQKITEPLRVFEKIDEVKKQKERKALEKDEDIRSDVNHKILKVKEQMFLSIRKKDVAESVRNYNRLKFLFALYPSRFVEEKKELYQDMISFYMRIKKISAIVKEKQKQEFEEKVAEQSNQQPLHIKEINDIINQIKEDTKQLNFSDAKAKIIDLKHLTSKLSEDKTQIKKILESRIQLINKRIDFVKKLNDAGKINVVKVREPVKI